MGEAQGLRDRLTVLLSAVAALTLLVPVGAQGRFEVVLWVDGAADRPDRFWEHVRELGFTSVSLSRGEDASRPARFGLGFYCDQLAGKGILELRDGQWSPVLDAFLADRDPAALVRPACLADPSTRDELLAKVEASLRTAVGFGPFAASLGDEASATRRSNPLDLCMSDAYREAFRAWLEARHDHDIGRLNTRWGVGYGSFAQVEPWTTDRIRARELQGRHLPRNLAPWSDRLEFTDRLFADLVGDAIDLVERIAPGLGCGLTGMSPPSAFGGHDYARLIPRMTFYEVYDIGGAWDLADAFGDPRALRFATLFPRDAEQPPDTIDARLGSMVAHGMSGTVVWNASEAFDDGGGARGFARRIDAVMRRIGPAADEFAGARIVRAPVWIVESQPSVRAHWMLDSSPDGATWPRRLSSWEAEHGTSLRARHSWVALLNDLGLQPDFVPAAELPDRLRVSPPRLLVLPACLALADAEVAAIVAFVGAGGHALADHGLALYDDALRLRGRAALDETFGVIGRSTAIEDQLVSNGRGGSVRLPSGAAVAEARIAGEIGDRTADPAVMVQIEARPGLGRTTYLNLAVCEYASVRLVPERVATARELRKRVQRALDAAGVEPPVMVRADGFPTCIERMILRARDGRTLLAVRVDALESPELMRRLGERGARSIELAFPAAVEIRDLVTDALLPPAPDGPRGQVFETTLDPWRPLLLELVPR